MLERILELDLKILNFLYSIRTPFEAQLFYFLTGMGGIYFIAVASIVLAVYLLRRQKYQESVLFLFFLLGTYATVYLLKIEIGRVRPATDFSYVILNSPAFPSGHSASAVFLYGFLGYLIFRSNLKKLWKKILVSVCILAIILIGLSRMYLGVHYLSDVLGGFVVGFTALLLLLWSSAGPRVNGSKINT